MNSLIVVTQFHEVDLLSWNFQLEKNIVNYFVWGWIFFVRHLVLERFFFEAASEVIKNAC